jgi:predicted transcriptional regulator
MELQVISESELMLMRIIWAKGGVAMFADIMEYLAARGNTMHNNTALTLLNRLIEKKFLRIGKIGRRNEYRAAVSRDDYNAAQTKTFMDKVYGGSVRDMVNTLLSHDLVSEADREELRRFWKGGAGDE